MLELGIIGATLALLWWAFKQPYPDTKPRREGLNTACPLIPDIPNAKISRCQSFTNPTVSYSLNLQTLTCTCPDWKNRHGRYPERAPMALCKHLRTLLLQQHKDAIHPAMAELLADDFSAKFRWVHELAIGGDTILISGTQQGEWLNIYAPKTTTKTKTYIRYGYHPNEDRWSYDKKPAAAHHLAPILNKLGPYV